MASPSAALTSSAPRSCVRRYAFPLLLLALLALQALGLFYFTRGFFLTRFELAAHQTCTVPDTQARRDETIARLQKNKLRGSAIAEKEEEDTAAFDENDGEASVTPSSSCWFPRQYDAVTILLIDALRFDFLISNRTEIDAFNREQKDAQRAAGLDPGSAPAVAAESIPPWAPHANGIPIVGDLLRSAETAPHSALFRFEADPPTVTMQRLKGLTTGGLPTFIDIKDNFGSNAIEEDNWVWQSAHRGHGQRRRKGASTKGASPPSSPRMQFFGDDTWFDLYPPKAHFTPESKPFPSFNVADLHTVDNGCMEGLDAAEGVERERMQKELESLHAQTSSPSSVPPRQWDILLAHFLGVDHVGHRFHPAHAVMRPKLAQMQEVLRKQSRIIEEQRKVNRAIRDERKRRAASAGGDTDVLPPLPREQHMLLLVLGDHGMTVQGNHGGQTPEEIYSGLFVYSTRHVSQSMGEGDKDSEDTSASRKRTTPEGRVLEDIRSMDSIAFDSSPASPAPATASSIPSLPPLSPVFTSYRTIPQVDLVPTLSLLLGLPIPFGNVGKIVLELAWGREEIENDQDSQEEEKMSTEEHVASLMRERIVSFLPLLLALRLNALQLFQYLSAYAALQPGTFTAQEMHALTAAFQWGEDGWAEELSVLTSESVRSIPLREVDRLRQLERQCIATARAFHSFLSRSASLAQEKWTTFDLSSMGQGILLLFFCTLVRLVYVANEKSLEWMSSHHPKIGKRFAHPAWSLLKLISLLGLAVGLPLGLGAIVLPDDDGNEGGGESVRRIVRTHGPFVLGLLVTSTALGALVWNYAKKARAIIVASRGGTKGAGSLVRAWAHELHKSIRASSVQQYVTVLATLFYAQGLFSNSFIIEESSVVLFALVVLAVSMLFGSGRSGGEDDDDEQSAPPDVAPAASWSNALHVLLLVVSLRVMTYASFSTAPDASLLDGDKYSGADVAAMLLSLAGVAVCGVVSARFFVRGTMGLGAEPTIRNTRRVLLAVNFVLFPLGIACVLLYWTLQTPASSAGAAAATSVSAAWVFSFAAVLRSALQLLLAPFGASEEPAFARFVRLWLPRITFVLAGVGVLLAAFMSVGSEPVPPKAVHSKREEDSISANGRSAASPLDATVERDGSDSAQAASGVARRRRDPVASSSSSSAVFASNESTLRSFAADADADDDLSDNARSHSRGALQQSSSLIALRVVSLANALSLPLLLLWGPKSSVVLLGTWIVCVALVRLQPPVCASASSFGLSRLSFLELAFFFFLSAHLFYSTGHALSFSSLQVVSAFTGMDGFHFVLSGTMLMANTFGGIVVAALGALGVSAARGAREARQQQQPTQTQQPLQHPFVSLLHSLSLLFLCRTLLSVLNVTLHRRHLMVWAIFAPKFMFDAVGGVVAELVVLALAAAAARWTQ